MACALNPPDSLALVPLSPIEGIEDFLAQGGKYETLQVALDDTLQRYVLMEDKWKEQIAATEDAVSKLGECKVECERQKDEMRTAWRTIERLRASVKRGEEEIKGLQAAAVILQREADIGLQSREEHQKP
eukprot:1423648-Rhodomonas_salina.1